MWELFGRTHKGIFGAATKTFAGEDFFAVAGGMCRRTFAPATQTFGGATICRRRGFADRDSLLPSPALFTVFPWPLMTTPAASTTLLLIDDSISDLRVLLDLLAARKWRTVVAFDGQDGYRKAALKQPDLILLDVRMPKVDGFATCRLLKADPRTASIPVIFLTAAADKDDRLIGLGLGAVDYIVKPYASEEEVLARVGIHLTLARRLGGQTQAPDPAPDGSPLVKAASAILLDNLTSPPTPEVLARQLGTNERRLNEAFHAAYALPVMAWVREQRLRLARQLLVQTETSVADIAAHCGYGSPANFATAFRERFECTPREFRQRVQSACLDAEEID